jgi:hypothetical protein
VQSLESLPHVALRVYVRRDTVFTVCGYGTMSQD